MEMLKDKKEVTVGPIAKKPKLKYDSTLFFFDEFYNNYIKHIVLVLWQ